mgnify:CR=1 FL=1
MHILRVLNVQNKCFNNFVNLPNNNIQKIIKKLNDILYIGHTLFCTVCGKTLNSNTINIIMHCNNDDCLIKSLNLPIRNIVYKICNEEPEKLLFLIKLLTSGSKHKFANDTYHPLPKIANCKTIDDIKNDIVCNFNSYNFDLDKFKDCENELELFLKCKNNEYAYYKNAILNNYFSLATSNLINDDNVDIFNVNYDAEKENHFNNMNSSYLFHGSSVECWYTIIKIIDSY